MSIFKKLFGEKHDGQTPEFKAFLEGGMEGLRLQTEAHQGTWRFGKSERWDFSQDTGELIFTFPDTIVRAPAQIVGSFDSTDGSWMWAWANSSVAASLARDSVRVREYGESTGFGGLPHRVGRVWRWTAGTWRHLPIGSVSATAFTADLQARHLCFSLSVRFS